MGSTPHLFLMRYRVKIPEKNIDRSFTYTGQIAYPDPDGDLTHIKWDEKLRSAIIFESEPNEEGYVNIYVGLPDFRGVVA